MLVLDDVADIAKEDEKPKDEETKKEEEKSEETKEEKKSKEEEKNSDDKDEKPNETDEKLEETPIIENEVNQINRDGELPAVVSAKLSFLSCVLESSFSKFIPRVFVYSERCSNET